jgi:hypothetical protein
LRGCAHCRKINALDGEFILGHLKKKMFHCNGMFLYPSTYHNYNICIIS